MAQEQRVALGHRARPHVLDDAVGIDQERGRDGNADQQGKVRSRGLELEARYQRDSLGLIGAYSYTDARILDSADPDEEGQRLGMVPFHAASLWLDYGLDGVGWRGFSLGGGVTYTGSTNLTGIEPDVPGYLLVDAVARYDLSVWGGRFDGTSVTLNARNLLDKDYYTCSYADGCRYGSPVTLVATLSHHW